MTKVIRAYGRTWEALGDASIRETALALAEGRAEISDAPPVLSSDVADLLAGLGLESISELAEIVALKRRGSPDVEALIEDRGGWWMLVAPGVDLSIEERPSYCDRGRYIVKAHPKGTDLHVDWADGFPRYYFSRTRMVEELDAWLRARGQL